MPILIHRGIQPRQLEVLLVCLAEKVQGTRAVLFASNQCVYRVDQLHESLGVAEPDPLGGELLLFSLHELGRPDFLDLVAEQIDLSGRLPLVPGHLLNLPAHRPELSDGRGDISTKGDQPSVAVQITDMLAHP